MALNEIFKLGANVSLPVPAGTQSGDPVRVGIINGVAQVNVGDGQNIAGYASVKSYGAFLVPVAGAVAVGDPIYIADGELSTDDAGELWGVALQAQAADGQITVRVIPESPATAGA